MIVTGLKLASPAGFCSPSPTIDASPSIAKTICVLPENGIGVCPDNLARDECPLAFENTSDTNSAGNRFVDFVIVAIFFILL